MRSHGKGPSSISELVNQIDTWLEINWDPDLTVGAWWERLGTSGWAAPGLPAHAYGKGLARTDAVTVAQRIRAHGALPAPGGLGMLLAAPTIAVHGTADQVDRYVRPIVTGGQAWCQLFSEPAAGSDLAGLATRAVRDGDEWIVNGQKVWTSGGRVADMGMLIARTDPDAPKHAGITWFALDMNQPGIEVRPLREMTGRALFSEVFLTDARVADAATIGGAGQGWAVANATLAYERSGLGAGGSTGPSLAQSGTVAGDLDKRAGDLVAAGQRGGDGVPSGLTSVSPETLIEIARARGRAADPIVRQGLARLHILTRIGRYSALRLKSEQAAGREIPGAANLAKLSLSEIIRLARDVSLHVVGPYGTLHGYHRADRAQLATGVGMTGLDAVTEMALFAQAPPIYGGTDQIQRNIIGERVLGLPKEPGDDRSTPWRSLLRNG